MTSYRFPIRTVHHFACSGGTVVSKCIAVCGDSFFLSEINPMAPYNVVKFAPLDLMSQLHGRHLVLKKPQRMRYFGDQMRQLCELAEEAGRPVCLRDHTQSSFFHPGGIKESQLLEALRELGYDTLSVATVRHPIDTFAALLKNNWANVINNSFQAYCEKTEAFLDYCERRNIRIWRYEDFCIDPATVLRQMCDVLDLRFNEDFMKEFPDVKLTGDSGRKSTGIHLRERRSVAPDLAAEAAGNGLYHSLCERLGYAPGVKDHPLSDVFG